MSHLGQAFGRYYKGIFRRCAVTNYVSAEQLAEMMRLITQARIEYWLRDVFGSWRWWVLLLLFIAPWVVWYKLADKKKLPELALFGLMVMVSTITLDELGFALSLWSYPADVIPIFPRLTSVDYTVLPISFTLTYQYFPTWKSFFWALVVISGVFSFVVEPIIAYLGFYVVIKWFYWYSFILYIATTLLLRWIARKFFDIAQRS